MKRIFITAIGGDIGYGVIKALKKSHHELYIVGCDIQKYNYCYDLVDQFYLSPMYRNVEAWKRFVLEVIEKENIDYFWPVTEPEIKLVAQNRELFSKVTVIMNQEEVLEVAMDKGKTAQYLQNAGVQTPTTWNAPEECVEKYPLVVKEKFGCGSHGVSLVQDHETLVSEFNRMEDPIIQKCVGTADEEYTMTIFSNGKVVNYIAFKRTLGFGGMSRFVELVQDAVLEDYAQKIAKLFSLKGSINVQMRKEEQQYYVFEINPRISSTMGFRLQLGFNDAGWWLDELEGIEVEAYHAPKGNVYGVRNVEEKLFYE